MIPAMDRRILGGDRTLYADHPAHRAPASERDEVRS